LTLESQKGGHIFLKAWKILENVVGLMVGKHRLEKTELNFVDPTKPDN
jgi:hypothetical protein